MTKPLGRKLREYYYRIQGKPITKGFPVYNAGKQIPHDVKPRKKRKLFL